MPPSPLGEVSRMIIELVGNSEDITDPDKRFGGRPEAIFPPKVAEALRRDASLTKMIRLIGQGWSEIRLNDGPKAGGVSIVVGTLPEGYQVTVDVPGCELFKIIVPYKKPPSGPWLRAVKPA